MFLRLALWSASRRVPSACPTKPVRVWPILPLVVVVAALMCVYAYALERDITADDGGFLNPVLEYVHHGHVVYPAHGFPKSMPVHPPVHYWLGGILMKTGLRFYPAMSTLPVIYGLIAVTAIATAPFSDALKMGLLMGTFLPTFALNYLNLRPEPESAMAWIAGLVLMESGRLLNWDPGRLALGSFLVAYASGLQYYALPAVGGCAVYMVFAMAALGFRKGWKKALWIFAGAALFMTPYLGLFLLPNRQEILQLIAAQSPSLNPVDLIRFEALARSFRMHRLQYSPEYTSIARPVYAALIRPLTPVLAAQIPAVFVSTPILWSFRQLRVLAIAALPVQLSLLFLTHHKGGTYFLHEFTLLFAAEFALGWTALTWMLRHVIGSESRRTWCLSTSAAGVLLLGCPIWPLSRAPWFVDDLALARAAGKEMLGQDAVVGGRSICLWYTSGAAYYRNFVGDLIYRRDISTLNPRAFFAMFDGVAEDPNGSWITYNRQQMVTASWYLNRVLQLQGFYAGHVAYGGNDGYSYFMTVLDRKRPIQGWYWIGRRFRHFIEDPGGDSLLVAITNPPTTRDGILGPEAPILARFGLPPEHQVYLSFHVFPKPDLQVLATRLPATARLHDAVIGRIEDTDPGAMALSVDYHREMTRVFFDGAEFLAALAVPAGADPIPVLLQNVNAKGSLEPTAGNNGSLRYRISHVGEEPLLYSRAVDLKDGGVYVLEFGLKIGRGNVKIVVADGKQSRNATETSKFRPQALTQERLVIDADEFPQVVMMVWSGNQSPAPADFELQNVRLWKALPRGRKHR